MLKNKKSQLKIQEMSFMLLGLVLFFIIAGMFFLMMSNSGLKKSYAGLSEAKSIASISKLVDSPELSYGKALSVDVDKVVVLKSRESFQDFWEVEGGLVIQRIYPYSEEENECFLGASLNCNTLTLKEVEGDYNEISSFVALCRKETKSGYVYDKCELGKISAYVEK